MDIEGERVEVLPLAGKKGEWFNFWSPGAVYGVRPSEIIDSV